jgi:hypothetical protein
LNNLSRSVRIPLTLSYSLQTFVSRLKPLGAVSALATDRFLPLPTDWWDWTTSIEEVMHSLDILVKQGKVLYLGISDTPAWIVSAANVYAR